MPTPGGPYSGIWNIRDTSKFIQDNAWPFFFGASRVVIGGGRNSGVQNIIDFVDLSSAGDATDFGDLTAARQGPASTGSRTRALFAGGATPTRVNTIDFVQFTLGNAIDFGDISNTVRDFGACTNGTRGIFAGGSYTSSPVNKFENVIQFCAIASTGNTSDFGDLTTSRGPTVGNMCSTTRGVFGFGGTNPSNGDANVIDFITMASAGNATDFGDATSNKQQGSCLSSSTRGVMGGGGSSPSRKSNVMEFITVASTGNATDFGDLSQDIGLLCGSADDTKGIFFGGLTSSTYSNVIDQITIASTGNATDFGDLTLGRDAASGTCSNMGAFG